MYTGRTLNKNPSILSNCSSSTSSPSSRISPALLTKKSSHEVLGIQTTRYSSTSRNKTPQKEAHLRSNASSKTLNPPSNSLANFNSSKIVRSQPDIVVSPSSVGSRSPSQGSPTLQKKVVEYTESSSSPSSLLKKDKVENKNIKKTEPEPEERPIVRKLDPNFSFESPHNLQASVENKYEQLFHDKLADLIQNLQDIKESLSPLIDPESFSSKTWEVENSTSSSLFTIFKNCEKQWKSFDDYALKFIIREQIRARGENNPEDERAVNCFLEELYKFEENLETQKARIEEITTKRMKEKERAGEYIDILTKGLTEVKERVNKDFDLVEKLFETNRFTALLQSELKNMNQFTNQTFEKVQHFWNPKKPTPQLSSTSRTTSGNSLMKKPTQEKKDQSTSRSPLRKTPITRDTIPLAVKKETSDPHDFQILKEYFEKMKEYNMRFIRIIHDVESEKLEIERLVLNAKDSINLESNKLINQIENSFSSRIRSLETTNSSRSSQKVILTHEMKEGTEKDTIDKIHSEFLLEEYKITTEDLSNKVRALEEEAKGNRENTSQQIHSLLLKIQSLSNEYELYKEEKEKSLKTLLETKEEEYLKFWAIIEQKDKLINIIREENEILRKELPITSQVPEHILTEETLDLEDFKNERNKYVSMDTKDYEDQVAPQDYNNSPKEKKPNSNKSSKNVKQEDKEKLLKEDNVLELLFMELMQAKNKHKK